MTKYDDDLSLESRRRVGKSMGSGAGRFAGQ